MSESLNHPDRRAEQPPLDVFIMAAGKGTRMKSRLPKVLHRLAGRALMQNVTDTAAGLNAHSCVVITGHAVRQAVPAQAPRRTGSANAANSRLKKNRQPKYAASSSILRARLKTVPRCTVQDQTRIGEDCQISRKSAPIRSWDGQQVLPMSAFSGA